MVGFFVGRESKSVDVVSESTVIEQEIARDAYPSVGVKEESLQSKENSREVKILTRQERRERFEKTLEKYMNAAPYALVQKLFYKRLNKNDDLAFGGPYEKGEWGSDQRKEIEQAIFERTLPVIKQGLYYSAQGSLRFSGKDLPFEILMSFLDTPFDKKDSTIKIPTQVKDLTFSSSFAIDVSEIEPKLNRLQLGVGGGSYNLYNDGGRTFARAENYSIDTITSEARNLLYFLIELPNIEDTAGSIRIFNVQTSQWAEATDQLVWRRLTKNEYLEANEAFHNN